MGEISTKPFLIRALHEWCTENGYTPYIVVQVDAHTMVPMAHVQDGQITLNVGTLATNNLILGNDMIEFQARFGGRTETVSVHVGAVSAIYARETGAGMGFEVQPYEQSDADPANVQSPADSPAALADSPITAVASPDSSTSGEDPAAQSEIDAKRPHLTIVK